jgi:hypothetical protein
MEEIAGYNAGVSGMLKEFCQYSFFWVIPLKVLNTFMKNYFTEEIRQLLDVVCKEGLFWNHAYHSNLVMLVGQCSRAHERILKLERMFSLPSGKYHAMVELAGNYESVKNDVSVEQIADLSNQANIEAQEIVQEEGVHFYNMLTRINDIMQDTEKHEPSFVSNIKIVWSSRENNARKLLLQESLPQWDKFLDLMRNYVVIGG